MFKSCLSSRASICPRAHKSRQASAGFTLIEVLVAVAVIAVISVVSLQSIDSASRASDVTQRKFKQIQRMDRFWNFMAMDLRNALKYSIATPFGEAFEPMLIDPTEEYFLSHLRAGIANPLLIQRSELGRVGYRIDDNIVWRDSWSDPANSDDSLAYKQKLLDGVEEVVLTALQPGAPSAEERNWSDRWPIPGQQNVLPLAVNVNLVLEDGREISRIFMLSSGD